MKTEIIQKFKMPEGIDLSQFHGSSQKFLEFLAEYSPIIHSQWLNKYHQEQNNYKDLLENNSKFFSNIESHHIFLEDFFDVDFSTIKHIKFKSINFDSVRKDLAKYNEKIVESCESASKIIPRKYHKIFKHYDLYFGNFNFESYIDPKNKKINIRINENNDLMIINHDFIHELGHAIEYHNRNKILKKNFNFLKLRSYKIKDKNVYVKDDITNCFYNNLFYEYAGTIYTDPFYGDHNDPYTELLSVGLGLMYYSPIEFFYNDPEYFNYILSLMIDN